MSPDIYLLYHVAKNGKPQQTWIPTPAQAPVDHRLGHDGVMFFKRALGADPRLIYCRIDQLPHGSRWFYEVNRWYSTEPYDDPRAAMLDQFCADPRLVSDLHNGLGYLVYNDSREADLRHADTVTALFAKRDIPLSRVIYLSGAANVTEMFAQQGREMLSCYTHWFEIEACGALLEPHDHGSVQIPTHRPVRKRFLCFNRRIAARLHRIQLLAKVYRRGILDQFWYSFNATTEGFQLLELADRLNEPEHWDTAGAMRRLMPRLPLVLDRNDFDVNFHYDHVWKTDLADYYHQSAVSVITETLFHSTEIMLSEKTWHPIRYGQPFIMVGSAGMLAKLRQLGYRTWSDWWDESYDSITDHHQRLDAIVDLLCEISKWSDQRLQDFTVQSRDHCLHNQQWLRQAQSRHDMFSVLDGFWQQ
jgi:hypothetical protein